MPLNLSKGLTHIRGQVSPNNLTVECGGEKCKVYRTGLPRKRVVINVEKEFDARRDSRKRCDRLLFYRNAKHTFVAVPIELKSGKANESEVREKLENSLKFAATLAPDQKGSGETVYVPVLFHGRGINWTKPRRRQLTVNFQGKPVLVLIGRCGRKKNLANLLSEAGYL